VRKKQKQSKSKAEVRAKAKAKTSPPRTSALAVRRHVADAQTFAPRLLSYENSRCSDVT
jgi:hypothetical protein